MLNISLEYFPICDWIGAIILYSQLTQSECIKARTHFRHLLRCLCDRDMYVLWPVAYSSTVHHRIISSFTHHAHPKRAKSENSHFHYKPTIHSRLFTILIIKISPSNHTRNKKNKHTVDEDDALSCSIGNGSIA